MEDTEWNVIHRASGMINAHIVAGRLEAEGIPTRLSYEAIGAIYPITIDGLGEVKLLVPADCVERARDILSYAYDEE
jgi:hypothetical protein